MEPYDDDMDGETDRHIETVPERELTPRGADGGIGEWDGAGDDRAPYGYEDFDSYENGSRRRAAGVRADAQSARYGDGHDAPADRTTLLLTFTGILLIIALAGTLIAEVFGYTKSPVSDRTITILLALIAALVFGFDQALSMLPIGGPTRYHSRDAPGDDRRRG